MQDADKPQITTCKTGVHTKNLHVEHRWKTEHLCSASGWFIGLLTTVSVKLLCGKTSLSPQGHSVRENDCLVVWKNDLSEFQCSIITVCYLMIPDYSHGNNVTNPIMLKKNIEDSNLWMQILCLSLRSTFARHGGSRNRSALPSFLMGSWVTTKDHLFTWPVP